jgi:sialic acid synthase SpsE
LKIENREIGINFPTYFIAEIGSNFDGDIERAKSLIWLAKESGADAAKFQHYTADSLVSDFEFQKLKNESHQRTWKQSVFATYKQAELNVEWTSALAFEAKMANIHFFTSPYSYHLADCVENFVPAYKIGSVDITWIDYLKFIASKGKPVILATGASTQEEVDQAVTAVLDVNKHLVLMQCNTNYSGNTNNSKFVNLRVLSTFASKYPSLVLGLSDHSTSIASVLGAITLGARVIERHFTDDSSRDGPDHPFSTDPKSWRQMIAQSRELEEMLGDGIKRVEINESDARIVQRRSICAKRDLEAGHVLTADDLEFLRPCLANALVPSLASELLGKPLVKNFAKGETFLQSIIR